MKKLENCKKAEIFDDSGELLCTASVEMGPLDGLMMLIPQSFDSQKQPSYRVVFYDPTLGLLTCRCELYAPLKKPDNMCSVRCNVLQEISSEQRRMDMKVPLTIKIEIAILERGMAGEVYPATMLDISAGGVYITCEHELKTGSRFTFTFNETGTELSLIAEVLRVEEKTGRNGEHLFGYGCHFVRLPSQHEAQLRRYVFQRERYRYQGRR